jgi:hypothetical protein
MEGTTPDGRVLISVHIHVFVEYMLIIRNELLSYIRKCIRIKLKSSVAIVKKTDKFDSKGNPIYLLDHTVIPLISNADGQLQNIT